MKSKKLFKKIITATLALVMSLVPISSQMYSHAVDKPENSAKKLYIRHLDKNGSVLKSKTYTLEEIKKMVDDNLEGTKKDALYQTICSHRGITSYKATGITLDALLKNAGFDSYFKSGTEIRLRANGVNKDSKENDDENDMNSYYPGAAFSYEHMTSKMYNFPSIYSDKDAELSKQIIEDINKSKMGDDLRKHLASAKKDEAKPIIVYKYATKQFRNDQTSLDKDEVNKEFPFRFLHGISMDSKNPEMISSEETMMNAVKYLYSIDIYDTTEHVYDETKIRKSISKAESLSKENYTEDSWNKMQEALEKAKKILTAHKKIQENLNSAQKELDDAILNLISIPKEMIKDIKLSKNIFVHNGKIVKPKVIIKNKEGSIIPKSEYEIKYIKAKNVGKYTLKVKLKGVKYTGEKILSFKILPRGTSLKKLKSKKKSIIVMWKKNKTQTTGYQIQYSTSKKFSKAKMITIKSNKKAKAVLKKLKLKKKYSVRIRTFKTIKKSKFYSSWSKAKICKVR